MRSLIPWIATALLVAASPALASDWADWSQLDTISVLTVGDDGAEQDTTIWIVVVDGTAYIRTSESSPWGNAVEGAETIGVRVGEERRAVHATAISDASTRERVTAGFREKYGFSDALIGLFRGEARIWSVETVAP